MPEFDISIIKIAQTTEEFHVTAKDEESAKKVAIQAAKESDWYDEPEIIVDVVLECKGDNLG